MRQVISGTQKFLIRGVLLFVLFSCSFRVTAAAAEQEFTIEPTPSWTSSVEIDTNKNALEETASGGVFYLLVNVEINGATKERYLHFAKKFLSSAGVEENSQLSFDFDPAYQKLILHKIVIHRGNEVLNELDPAKIRVIQQERDLDRLLYNGTKTAFLFLEDVRVGDWVEFAFTIRGRNPLEKEYFYDTMQMRWSFPVQTENYRLLWPRSYRPLWVQLTGNAPHNRNVTDQFYEYAWQWKNRPGQEFEDFVPTSLMPYSTAQFTDFGSWENVAIWAGESFHAQSPSKEFQDKVLAIQSGATWGEERVVKALQFVQDDIRYLGIENGINARTPTDPSVVLARGYGDCKDKALLFCTILHAMGIEAAPVLVSTQLIGRVKDLNPSPWAFDHVIVQVVLLGRTNFVDVTRTFQRGPLRKRYIDDFGAGLLLSESSTGLINIPYSRAGSPTTVVDEYFNIPTNAPTRLTIVKTYEGRDADFVRGQLATASSDTLNKNALAYYRKYYADMTLGGALETEDDEKANRLRVTEHFVIPAIWKPSQRTNYIACTFYADGFMDRLIVPAKKDRRLPLAVPFPENYLQRIQIDTPEVWRIVLEDKKIQTKGFLFHHNTSYTNNGLVIVNQLVTLDRGVNAADVPGYLEALDQIPQFLGLTISKPVRTTLFAGSPNWTILIAVASYSMVLVMLSVFVYRFKFQEPPVLLNPDSALAGLGGWLILVGIGLVGGMFILPARIAKLSPVYSSERWRIITDSADARYNAMLPPILLFELFTSITVLILLILLTISFFRKRRIFPILFITFLILQFVFAALDAILVGYMHRNSVMTHSNAVSTAALGPLMISLVLWTLYMLRSRRVKLTFVN
jgi:transglutaminase-like putative cysteine protease